MTSMQDALKRGRANIAAYLAATGVRCTVYGLTWNGNKGLWEPATAPTKQHISFSIISIAGIKDPNITTVVQAMNISFEEYRQLTTVAAGKITFKPDFRIVREPVTDTSDTYQVVQAVQPDETSPMTLILHCRKL